MNLCVGRGPVAGLAVLVVSLCGTAFGGSTPPPPTLNTTSTDFEELGTVAGDLVLPLLNSGACLFCHSQFDFNVEPGRWAGSMHAQSVRDPVWQAAVTIASQDAAFSVETCLKCHSPLAHFGGRGVDVNGQIDYASLQPADFDGVTCNVCHRLVDPVYEAGVSPTVDDMIIMALTNGPPVTPGNAQYVLDPDDVRRGPFNDLGAGHPHSWLYSPFHQEGDLCQTCHDVSNPTLSKQMDGSYQLNSINAQHPTHDKHDMFPEQRTYTEWSLSEFAATGVDMGGLFGGNKVVVSTCQDCHMPDVTGEACIPPFDPVFRTDLPLHTFQGANNTALEMILHQYSEELDETMVDAINANLAANLTMLQNATDMELTQNGCQLEVKITNNCGHKLLTGYPEGRRIWINVKYYDGAVLVAERGFYDTGTAALTTTDTKVYETVMGIDATQSAATGEPVGPSFHLVFLNTILKDNRIPPRGFDNAAFEAGQAGHVGYSYADGQYWDETGYGIPVDADSAEVTLYYQSFSREYIEFLRDENQTDSKGTDLWNTYVATGMSAPIVMDQMTVPLTPFQEGDIDGDGDVDFDDLNIVLSNWGATQSLLRDGDADKDGDVDFDDLNVVLGFWGQSL